MSNKKRSVKDNNIRLSDVVSLVFLFCIFGIYPWIMHDRYFDITKTRSTFIIYSICIYCLLFLATIIIDRMIYKDSFFVEEDSKIIALPELWMGLFAVANLAAFAVVLMDNSVVGHDKAGKPITKAMQAFEGSNGRMMGLFMYILLAIMFFVIARYLKINLNIFIVLAATTLYAYLVAIFQHVNLPIDENTHSLIRKFSNHCVGLKEGIAKRQYDVFYSTLGNINIFACFIVITLSVFIFMYIFSKEIRYKVISAIVLVAGGFSIMIANSDSAYIGLSVAIYLAFILAIKDKKFIDFLLAMFFIALGNLGTVILNKKVIVFYDKRGGFATALDRMDYAIIICLVLAFLVAAAILVKKFLSKYLEKINTKKLIVGILIATAVMIVAVVIVGIKKQMSIFKFNYKWGTYRGYIWTKSGELFKDAPFINKLFGYGNESVKSLMVGSYNDEMIAVTKKVYDNCHNELLQYLITTGIFGLVTYLGLFISSFIYILKNSKKQVIAYACLGAMTGYFVQALININQPITTPLYFVIMAVGVGYVRYLKKEGNKDD